MLISAKPLEVLATSACLANVYLVYRNNMWNWLFGIIAVSLYFVIFLQVKLYADMGLQIIFFLMQFYGLYQWLHGGEQHTSRAITHASLLINLLATLLTLFLFGNLTYFLKTYTDSTTIYLDALTTALSIVAQWLMSKKWIEHWFFWFLSNCIAISMYVGKHLYFTAFLYVIFVFLNFAGYYHWKKLMTKKSCTS